MNFGGITTSHLRPSYMDHYIWGVATKWKSVIQRNQSFGLFRFKTGKINESKKIRINTSVFGDEHQCNYWLLLKNYFVSFCICRSTTFLTIRSTKTLEWFGAQISWVHLLGFSTIFPNASGHQIYLLGGLFEDIS